MDRTEVFKSPGGIKTWVIKLEDMQVVNEWLQSANWTTNIKLLFESKQGIVFSARLYPMFLNQIIIHGSQPEVVKIADMTVGGLTTHIIGYDATRLPAVIEYATFTIEPYWNNFLDYEPYTMYTIHLPYVGEIKLPTAMVLNEELKVYYIFDWLGGSIMTEIRRTSDDVLVASEVGKCHQEIPLTESNSDDIARNIAGAVVNTGLKAVGIGFGARTIGTTSKDVAYGTKEKVTTSNNHTVTKGKTPTMAENGKRSVTMSNVTNEGTKREVTNQDTTHMESEIFRRSVRTYQYFNTAGDFAESLIDSNIRTNVSLGATNFGFYSDIDCYLTRTTVNKETYGLAFEQTFGKPVRDYYNISNLVGTGYTVFEDVRLNSIAGATVEEIEEIKDLLQGGVIL